MEIISVVSPKGGVGKSTIATMLADFEAVIKNKKVCYVDLDPQASGQYLLHHENIEYLTEVPRDEPDADYLIIDYPPSATLPQKFYGHLFIVVNPDFLSAMRTIKDLKTGVYDSFKSKTLLINRVDKRRVDHREAVVKLREIVSELKNNDDSGKFEYCRVKMMTEISVIQRAQNLQKTILGLNEEEIKSLHRAAEIREALIKELHTY